MAFADTLLSETEATMALVDRRHRPGGHWNDAYPFVRPHQPPSFYGVSSRSLLGPRAGSPQSARFVTGTPRPIAAVMRFRGRFLFPCPPFRTRPASLRRYVFQVPARLADRCRP